jgi:hypothetical protein
MPDRPYQPAEATAYLQVRLNRKTTYGASEASVVGLTQNKPSQPKPGCIVVKAKIRIPVEGWDPFEPEAVIDIPVGMIQHPIEIEVESPDG